MKPGGVVVDFSIIRDRVTIPGILVDVGLKPTGNRMPCPIHGGRNPTSFQIGETTFKCHSCGAGGGLIDLTMLLHSCNRREAMERLCRMANVPFSNCMTSLKGMRREKRKSRISRLINEIRWQREHPRRRDPLMESSEYFEAVARLEWLSLFRDSLDRRLRMIKRAVSNGAISLVDFYTKEQVFLHQFEEIDEAINVQKYQVSQIEKGGNRNANTGTCHTK